MEPTADQRKLRAFIALKTPPGWDEKLEALQRDLKPKFGSSAFRWVKPAQIHITLRFFGWLTTKEIEELNHILPGIASAHPRHGILGEEHGHEPGGEPWTWVVDPIDGTKSFVVGQLSWGTLIALNDGTRPVVGVACQPFVGEAFVARQGGPAQWRRGGERRTLRTRRCPRIEDAIVVTTDPRFFAAPREAAAYAAVTSRARYTRYGGDLYCYTQLAMGLTDVVIERVLNKMTLKDLMRSESDMLGFMQVRVRESAESATAPLAIAH